MQVHRQPQHGANRQVVYPHNPILDNTLEVGQTRAIQVYIRDGEILRENPSPGSSKPPIDIFIPYSQEVKNFESGDATEILNGFEHDNRAMAGDFGRPEIKSFKVAIDNVQNIGFDFMMPSPQDPGQPAGAIHYDPSSHDPKHPNQIDRFDPNIIQVMPGSASPKAFASRHEALGLTDAEAVESYEDRTRYWKAGRTNGEALSRSISGSLQSKVARDPIYTSGPEQSWWQDGHKDYINGNPDFATLHEGDRRQASDQDVDSNGAGPLFLDYLHNKLHFSWKNIIHDGAPTLGGTYAKLMSGRGIKTTGKQGFDNFVTALRHDRNKSGDLALPPDGNPFQVG